MNTLTQLDLSSPWVQVKKVNGHTHSWWNFFTMPSKRPFVHQSTSKRDARSNMHKWPFFAYDKCDAILKRTQSKNNFQSFWLRNTRTTWICTIFRKTFPHFSPNCEILIYQKFMQIQVILIFPPSSFTQSWYELGTSEYSNTVFFFKL